mmetsp:Transcript_25265/g.59134  ORF Transcript_25265/g.59134 Transcript_25265/m.59134 type:complete len:316 (-) Transcript_25265:1277-2224(-)
MKGVTRWRKGGRIDIGTSGMYCIIRIPIDINRVERGIGIYFFHAIAFDEGIVVGCEHRDDIGGTRPSLRDELVRKEGIVVFQKIFGLSGSTWSSCASWYVRVGHDQLISRGIGTGYFEDRFDVLAGAAAAIPIGHTRGFHRVTISRAFGRRENLVPIKVALQKARCCGSTDLSHVVTDIIEEFSLEHRLLVVDTDCPVNSSRKRLAFIGGRDGFASDVGKAASSHSDDDQLLGVIVAVDDTGLGATQDFDGLSVKFLGKGLVQPFFQRQLHPSVELGRGNLSDAIGVAQLGPARGLVVDDQSCRDRRIFVRCAHD